MGASAKEEEKKAISTQAVCIPPGSPSEARLVLTDGWVVVVVMGGGGGDG